mgnify:CR=1 FL=1
MKRRELLSSLAALVVAPWRQWVPDRTRPALSEEDLGTVQADPTPRHYSYTLEWRG